MAESGFFDAQAFVRELPKAELHLHLEGTLEPELMFELAERNGQRLAFDDVDALRNAYRFDGLQAFLNLYYQGMEVLKTAQDFYDLTHAYLRRAHQDCVLHTEIFFDPQAHVGRGVDLAAVVDGVTGAMGEAEREWGISSGLIFSFLRHLPAREAESIFRQARPLMDRFVAVGLDSAERGNPPGPFASVYGEARALGLRTVAHAGEEGPPAYVWEALESLHVDRIDHGNRSLEDERLVIELVARQTPLTLCPLSNLKLGVVDELQWHPLRRMLEMGLKVTVNSDDPAYFGGYINDNYLAVASALSLQRELLERLARNSFESAFAEPARITGWLDRLDDYCVQAP